MMNQETEVVQTANGFPDPQSRYQSNHPTGIIQPDVV